MITEIIKETYHTLTRKVDRSFFLHNEQKSYPIHAETQQWKSYVFLRRKYNRMLAALPETQPEQKNSRIIWWCWLQGADQAPELCKACLASLHRELPDYDLRIIDYSCLGEYLDIPSYILDKRKRGIIGGAHFSDIIRVMLLVKFGGVWIDSSVYCTGYQVPLFDEPLFVYQNWKFDLTYASIASNWLISASIGHPILYATQEMLLDYWKSNDKAIDYYLFHHLFHLAADRYSDLWKAVPRFSNIPPHILQYELFRPYSEERFAQIKGMSGFHKLNWKAPEINGDTKGSFFEHLIQNAR